MERRRRDAAAGADLISVGTALFMDPMAPVNITEGIKNYLDRKKITSVSELTGRVLPYSMTTIYLIRHAEAEGNLYRRIHGRYDSLVTVRGKKQIEQLTRRFDGIQVDHVYSSDLYRARATAGAVLINRGLTLTPTPELREVDMGAWEDRTWGEVERFEPEQLHFFNNDPSQWKVEGCEDYFSLQRRITARSATSQPATPAKRWRSSPTVRRSGRSCAGVCGVPPTDISRVKHYDNTAVTLLRIGGGKINVEYAGDNSHLPEELSTFAHQKWWRENSTFDSTNLRFVPFDLEDDAQTYLKFRMDAWMMLYGEAPATPTRVTGSIPPAGMPTRTRAPSPWRSYTTRRSALSNWIRSAARTITPASSNSSI